LPWFRYFTEPRIDNLKAHIRDTDLPPCPNSYEPLFTDVAEAVSVERKGDWGQNEKVVEREEGG
jgi:hypothetical protein